MQYLGLIYTTNIHWLSAPTDVQLDWEPVPTVSVELSVLLSSEYWSVGCDGNYSKGFVAHGEEFCRSLPVRHYGKMDVAKGSGKLGICVCFHLVHFWHKGSECVFYRILWTFINIDIYINNLYL